MNYNFNVGDRVVLSSLGKHIYSSDHPNDPREVEGVVTENFSWSRVWLAVSWDNGYDGHYIACELELATVHLEND